MIAMLEDLGSMGMGVLIYIMGQHLMVASNKGVKPQIQGIRSPENSASEPRVEE